jgi:hypothetical protein
MDTTAATTRSPTTTGRRLPRRSTGSYSLHIIMKNIYIFNDAMQLRRIKCEKTLLILIQNSDLYRIFLKEKRQFFSKK